MYFNFLFEIWAINEEIVNEIAQNACTGANFNNKTKKSAPTEKIVMHIYMYDKYNKWNTGIFWFCFIFQHSKVNKPSVQ